MMLSMASTMEQTIARIHIFLRDFCCDKGSRDRMIIGRHFTKWQNSQGSILVNSQSGVPCPVPNTILVIWWPGSLGTPVVHLETGWNQREYITFMDVDLKKKHQQADIITFCWFTGIVFCSHHILGNQPNFVKETQYWDGGNNLRNLQTQSNKTKMIWMERYH